MSARNESRPDPVAAASVPDSKRPRLQPPAPESPLATAVGDVMPPGLSSERPSGTPPVANETVQTSPPKLERTAPSRPSTASTVSETLEGDRVMRHLPNTPEHVFYRVKEAQLSELDLSLPSFKALLKQIQLFSEGVGILPKSAQRRFDKLNDEDMAWAREGVESKKHYSKEQQDPKQLVSPDDVRKVTLNSTECHLLSWTGASWDMSVNSRVLDLALERADGYISFARSRWICNGAISERYREFSRCEKKVSFCIYLELDFLGDSSAQRYSDDLDRLARRPMNTIISHTVDDCVDDCPLAVSINTGGSRLDLGICEAARWACLGDLLFACTDYTRAVEELPSLPKYLPAVVVDKAIWSLVVTTYDGERTTVWHGIEMGSTMDPQGVYQIIACMRLLGKWAEDTFWPWFAELLQESRREARLSRGYRKTCA